MAGNGELGEVTVLGAGPAGLAIAWELARRGINVTVSAPDPWAPWRASYGTFEGLLPIEYLPAVAYRYARPNWIDRKGRSFELDASYVRLDTNRLQTLLLSRARSEGVRFDDAGRKADDTYPEQGLCISATGRASRRDKSSRYQSAYGIWTKLSDEWIAPGDMIFMDLSGPTFSGAPSFLYGTREGDAHFLQETVLVSNEKEDFSRLQRRLEARLAARGLALGEQLAEERCLIEMGGAPSPGQGNVVHFGARAGLTHPSSGYQLARCLRLASSLAEVISQKAGSAPRRVAHFARNQLWNFERRMSWMLFNYGARVLAQLEHDTFGRFMEVFLSIPAEKLTSFVDGQLHLSATLALMTHTYHRSDPELRRRLAGFGPDPARIFGAALTSERNNE